MHNFGKGEVESSILSRSTIQSPAKSAVTAWLAAPWQTWPLSGTGMEHVGYRRGGVTQIWHSVREPFRSACM